MNQKPGELVGECALLPQSEVGADQQAECTGQKVVMHTPAAYLPQSHVPSSWTLPFLAWPQSKGKVNSPNLSLLNTKWLRHLLTSNILRGLLSFSMKFPYNSRSTEGEVTKWG